MDVGSASRCVLFLPHRIGIQADGWKSEAVLISSYFTYDVPFCFSAFHSRLILYISSSLTLKSSFYLKISALEHFQAVLSGIYSLRQFDHSLSCLTLFLTSPSQNPSAIAKLISPLFLENTRASEKCNVLARFGLSPVFVNKASLEHSHVHLFTCCLWLLSCYLPWFIGCDRDHLAPKA